MYTEYVSGITVKKQTVTGEQDVYSGGKAYDITIKAGGSQYLFSHGIGSNTTISSGGIQDVYRKAVVSNTKIKDEGRQYISSGGHAFNTYISSGGIQVVNDLGYTTDNIIFDGGSQIVSGHAHNTTIKDGGCQYLQYYRAGAGNTTISSGASQIVISGSVSNSVIKNGGTLSISSYASGNKLTVSSGGFLYLANANIGDLSAAKGANLIVTGSALTLYGQNNELSNIKVNAANYVTVSMVTNSKLTLKGNVDLSKFTVEKGSVEIFGENNKVGSFSTSRSGSYHIEDFSKPNSKYILTVTDEDSTWYGTEYISVSKNQKLGTYKIDKGFIRDESCRFSVKVDGKNIGSDFLNEKITKNGVTYSGIYNSSKEFKLKLSIFGGKLYKGSRDSENLSGSVDSDIFYTSSGNDTVTGKNGRDVAVYDKTAWGKDIIAKTDGTMTLLFKDLKAADITKKTSGKDLVITKKGDTKQTITVKNYSADTHNIVFASNMTAFDKYLKTASPTTKQTTAARNEVWKKAGLASA